MAEYTKKTVADLQEILKSRGLATSGKKADLIARLTEADKEAETTTEAAQPTTSAEETAATSEPVPAVASAPAAEAQSAVPDEKVVPATEAPVADASAASDQTKESFALHLAASDVDQEMEKRKARAARFNTGGQANADAEATETATADTDALKNLERAKRFGTGQTAIGRLDEALPMERERGRKRGGPVPENAVADDPGLKRNFGRRGRFGKHRRNDPSKPTGVTKPGSGAFTSDKDRQAAEARKRRFAQA